jgi:hypothetical protein
MKKLSLLISAFMLSFVMFGQVLNEGFEGSFPPTGWTLDTISGSASWVAAANNNNSSISARTGSNLAYFYSANYNDDQTVLITPSFDISLTNSPELRFYHSQVDWGGDQDSLRVFYKTSTSGSWVLLATYNTAQLSWIERVLPLPNPSNDYYIAFEGTSGWGRGVTLDDITVAQAPSCVAPTALVSSNITSSGVDLAWTDPNSSYGWEILYGPSGFTIGVGDTAVYVYTTTATALTGLLSNTSYDYYVRAICGVGDTSARSAVGTFKTAFQCPAGAICGTYTAGDISSDDSFTSLPGNSTCPGTLTLAIPMGMKIDSVSTFYDATAPSAGNGWMSEQRSRLYSSNTMLGEPSLASGIGDNDGTYSYSRDGLTFANNATGNVSIDLEMGRTYGGSGCGTAVNYINNNSWTVIAYYSAIPACLAPSLLSSNVTSSSTAELNWTENGTATEWEIVYGTAGFTLGVGGDTVKVLTDTFTTITGLTAVTSYDWYVRAVCAVADSSSFTGPNSFTTPCAAVTLPYLEDFSTYIPSCWNEATGQLTNNTTFTSTTSSFWIADGFLNIGSSGSARMNIYSTGRFEWLISPSIDLGSAPHNYRLEFDAGLTDYTGSGIDLMGPDDTLSVVISTDNGVTWSSTNVVKLYDENSPPSNSGETVFINLSAYTGLIKVGFYATSTVSNTDYNVYIDNFQVRTTPACPAPSANAASQISSNSAVVSWLENGTATEWEVIYGTAGFTLGVGGDTVTVLTDTFTTITGLSAVTSYDWYVRTVCGPNDTSALTSVSTFTTPCAPVIAPFTESFDNTTVPNCWSRYEATGSGWVFGTPGFSWNTSGCAASTPSDHTGNSGNFAALDFSVPDAGVVLELPTVDVSALNIPMLSFYFQMCGQGYSPLNELYIEAFDGTTWNVVTLIQQGTSGWEKFEFIVSSSIFNTNQVKLRFRAEDGGGTQFYGDMAIDDVSIIEAPTCPDPTNLTVTATTATTASLSWTENGPATNWRIEYGAPGFTPGTGTFTSLVSNPYTLTGLISYNSYDYYVRSICGPTDSSLQVGPMQFTVGSPLSGAYTIDSSLATGGTNFRDFTAFTSVINSIGVAGPVTVDVVAGSGPYNEQVAFGAIPGGSSVNTLAINGHGNSINYEPVTGDYRLLGFDGTEYVSVKNLNVASTSTLYGYGVHFMNGASHISIDSCNFDLSSVNSTSSLNSSGAISSSSATSTTGGAGSNFITISNSTFEGGTSASMYYGMRFNGANATDMDSNIRIINNQINNFYLYGIALDDVSASLIEGNDVNRANKVTVSTFYGIYTTGGCERDTVNANAFHDSHTSASSTTGTSYVIYNTSNDASATGPNIFVNNLIYNINSNGTTYAIYNSGSDNQYYIHNSISLDDQSATGGTTRGVYQTTAASGIVIQNNIISITKGGSGVKHGLYFNTATSTISSDYNNIYVNSAGTGAQSFGYENATTRALLSDWQLSSYGANSSSDDPLFVSTLIDLTPGNPTINNTGANLGVPTDFYGAVRSATPDMGAIEFVPPACIQPSGTMTSAIGGDSAIASWIEGGTATQWEVEYDTAGFTAGQGRFSSIVNVDTFKVITGLTANTNYDWYVRAICGSGVNDTSAAAGPNQFTTLCAAYAAPYSDNIESHSPTTSTAPYLSQCWNTTANNTTNTWNITSSGTTPSLGTGPLTANSGNNFFYFEASSGTAGNEAYLTSPVVDLAALTTPRLSFFYHMFGDGRAIMADLYVEAFDGTNFVLIDSIIGEQQTAQSDPFYKKNIDMSAFTGLTQIRFTAKWNGAQWGDVSLDDISIEETPLCVSPTNLITSVITSTSADFSWTDANAAAAPNYQYSYGPVGFTAGQGTQMVVASDSVTISGLSVATAYDWYVRALCGGTDTSSWSTVASFATSCATFTAPFLETFDGTSTPLCWSQSAVQDGPWVFGGPGFSWNTQGCTFVPTDHTGNSGKFAALDFSGSGVNDVVLEMPAVDVSALTNPYLEFYFVMCGTGYTPINKLYVEAFNGTAFVAVDSIQQGTNGWMSFGYDLTNFKYNTNEVKIRFRASSGANTVTMYLGDQAIDDVSIKEAPADNLAVTAIVNPNSGCGLSATSTVEMTIANLGAVAQSNFSVGYSVNGVAITPETYTGSIAPNTSANYIFTTTANLSANGTYAIEAYTSLANDYDKSNDSLSKSIISLLAVNTFPYAESFETNNGGWISGGVNSSWALGTPTGVIIDTASNGTQAWVTNLTGQYGASEFGFVNSPCFDFTSIPNPYLELDIFYDIEFQWDGALIQASSDQGVTWSTVGAKGDTVNWYNDTADAVAAVDPTGQSWTGDATLGSQNWITAKHYLNGMGGLPSVQIRVLFISDGSVFGEGFAFDNVKIYDKTPPVVTLPYYPIGIVNTEDATTGVADSLGVFCWISGTVAGVDLDGNTGISFTIIDQSGTNPEGMNIYNFADVSNYVVTEGDSIMLRGEIQQFNGLTELLPDSIRIIATGKSLPAHTLVSSLSEATESQLIEIRDFVVITPSGNGSYNFTATNGTDTLTIRVDADTDVNDSLSVAGRALVAGDTICSMKGIGGQFDNSNPYLSGYQIFPMRFSDIDTTSCITIIGIKDAEQNTSSIQFYPNPNNGQFKLQIENVTAPNSTLEIVNIQGQVVYNENLIINGSLSKDININVEKGIYFVKLSNKNGVKVEKLIIE